MSADDFAEIGRELAQARQRLLLSLPELSRRTKIGVPTLMAIERGDMRLLPGHFYVRSFLRAVAHEVGCDPDEVVRRYRTVSGEEPDPPLQIPEEVLKAHGYEPARDPRWSRAAQLLGLGVFVGISLYLLSGHQLRLPSLSARSAVRRAAAAPLGEPAGVGTTGTAMTPAPISPPATPVTSSSPSTSPPTQKPVPLAIDMRPKDSCWLTAVADGERVIYRLLDGGESARVEAHDDVVLRVGDAGVFSFSINGTAGRPLGAPGEAVTVHITPQNFREFLP